MKRFIAALALLFVASKSQAQPSRFVCDAGNARVTFDGRTAAYFASGTLVATSTCAGTRMAVYNEVCEQSPAFRFFFASVPGPAILGGKSARLEAAGTSTLLACRAP